MNQSEDQRERERERARERERGRERERELAEIMHADMCKFCCVPSVHNTGR
jgi:hypothetical protein